LLSGGGVGHDGRVRELLLRLICAVVVVATTVSVGPVAAASNVQHGDNEDESDQSGEGSSGDAVGGQVIGVTSSGDASVDATNESRDSTATSGDAEGTNTNLAFVGQTDSGVELDAADLTVTAATNAQEGDNAADVAQSSDVVTGDATAGQIAGVVTAPGGTADLVLANSSIGVDAESGDAGFDNGSATIVGLLGGGGADGAGAFVISVSNAVAPEPGTLNFVVSLTPVRNSKTKAKSDSTAVTAADTVTFTAETSDGSANSETDYEPVSGTFSFTPQPGKTTTTISSDTFVDGQCEQDENMFLTITSANGASIGDGVGEGTILFSNEC
jgi:hypothetical protein